MRCSAYRADGVASGPCGRVAVYRCVLSWSPLVDLHVCGNHRPADEHKFRTIIYLGEMDVSGTVVPLEALRERRRLREAK